MFGFYLWSIGGQTPRWRQHWQHFSFVPYKTNGIRVSVRLFRNRSQMISKCDKDTIQWRTRLHLVCFVFVLTTFWHYLWSVSERTHGNMESFVKLEFLKIYSAQELLQIVQLRAMFSFANKKEFPIFVFSSADSSCSTKQGNESKIFRPSNKVDAFFMITQDFGKFMYCTWTISLANLDDRFSYFAAFCGRCY